MTTDFAETEIAGIRAPYTQGAQSAVILAREEAQRYNHGYLGTEHLLLGLLRVEEGMATKLLSVLGVNLDRARHALEHMLSRGDRSVAPTDLSFAPRARRSLELAIEESRTFGRQPVRTEHLLLGLLRVEDGVAARILDAFDVNLALVRRTYHKFLAGTPDVPNLPRSQVITCRVSDRDLDAIDALVEAGIRSGRSDAAAWLISAGIDRNAELFQRVFDTVTEIRRLRGETQAAAQQVIIGPA